MYKLLLVDDNLLDREGLKTAVNWKDIGVEIVGACINGSQALEKAHELKPNIILTDIAMPVMNGIEMAERLKATQPQIKVVFMSCYNDFDFAKSAIDLNIYGYILKPVIPEELEKVISKVVNEFELEAFQQKEKDKMVRQLNESLPMVREQFWRELLLGNFLGPEDISRRMEFLKIETANALEIQVITVKLRGYYGRIFSI